MTSTSPSAILSRGLRLLRALPTWLALLLALLAVVLPVGGLLLRSLRVDEVVLADGTVLVAVDRVQERDGILRFSTQASPGAERVGERLRRDEVAEVRTVWSAYHHRFVASDDRLVGLLLNSLGIAFGGALLALLLGMPVAWILGRTDLPGRSVLALLTAVPALVPPFFVALGGARDWQSFVIALTGFEGAWLQRATSVLVFGLVLFPVVVLFVAPAYARLPAGPYEAARLLGGARAARRRVVAPAVRPAMAGAFLLVFVLALSDFAVPDLLGFMLPGGGAPTYTFATEILLQWKQEGNVGRAVATGVPYLAVTLVLVLSAVTLLRRSPAFAARTHEDALPARVCRPRTRWWLAGAWIALLFVSIGVPMAGIASWAGDGGESGGTGTPAVAVPHAGGRIGDIQGALDRTEGSRDDRDRWLRNSLGAALLAVLLAVPLARAALRGGRGWQVGVPVLGLLALATPGLALSVGTRLVHDALPSLPFLEEPVPSVLALVGRLLPVALLAAWLTLRQVRRAEEEAARLGGAGPWTRVATVVLRPGLPGLLAGLFLLAVLALRELEAVMVLDARILPMRLYDKIHFSRLADEANLLLYCVALQLLPAALLLGALAVGRRHRRDRAAGPGSAGP